ncbi:hypothetical protein GCM10027037_14030 [Mucilaginibacter koreensis]
MISPLATNSATRFMFIYEDETVFCTSDLDHFKKAITHREIGQIGTGEPLSIYNTDYQIEDITIEHYSWPTSIYEPKQTGEKYDYTINITVYLSLD